MSSAQDRLVELSEAIHDHPAPPRGMPPAPKPKGRPPKAAPPVSFIDAADTYIAPPQPPPPAAAAAAVYKQAAAKKEKQAADAKKDVDEKKRQEEIRVVNDYLSSEIFGPELDSLGLKPLSGKATLAEAETVHGMINSRLNLAYKTVFIETVMQTVGKTVAAIGADLFRMKHFEQFSDQMKADKDYFQREVTQCAIELDSSYVPSANLRLAFKLAAYTAEFHEAYKPRLPSPPPPPPAATRKAAPPPEQQRYPSSSLTGTGKEEVREG